MTTGFEYLLQGSILLSFFAPFEAIGVPREIVMLILIAVANGLVYMRNRDPRLSGLLIAITAGMWIPSIRPGMEIYFYSMIVIGLSVAVYDVLMGDR